MCERFLILRNALEMSQEDFGTRIGLSRSGVSNIEKGKRSINDRHIKLICSEFNVNEEWLRTGNGEMFMQTDETLLDELAHKYSLDGLDKKILSGYLELPAQQREIFKEYLMNLANSVSALHSVAAESSSIEAELDSYRQELEAEQKGKTSSPSAV